MARVEVPKKPRENAAQKRARQALEAVGGTSDQARRGEPDDELTVAATAAASAPAEEAAASPVVEPNVHIPHQDAVVLASEEANPFEFVRPPADADPLEQVGMARRGIARANLGLEKGLGKLQSEYIQSAGEYLWWVTQGTRLKDAGFKSVEKFAEPLGLTKQDVYRLRRAVPIHRAIGGMMDGALNERTYRELYKTIVDEKGEVPVTADGEPDVSPERQKALREQFALMQKLGKLTSTGAAEARRILMLGNDAGPIEIEPGAESGQGVVETLAKALRTNRIVSLEVLRDVKATDPEAAARYVAELKRSYEAAAEIIG